MVRVTLVGPELAGFTVPDPAASVRLLVPSPGNDELVMPTWNGNEFLLPDGRRPALRTFTPRRFDPEAWELDLDIVVHDDGAASSWAAAAQPGDAAAVSGPGRGYTVDTDAAAYLLVGDETAIPAIGQLLEALPPGMPAEVHIEVAHPDARLSLPEHAGAAVAWHEQAAGALPGDAMLAAVRDADIPDGARVWAAGEAAAVQGIRRHLFDERGMARSRTSVRGYWKSGRAGDSDGDSERESNNGSD